MCIECVYIMSGGMMVCVCGWVREGGRDNDDWAVSQCEAALIDLWSPCTH